MTSSPEKKFWTTPRIVIYGALISVFVVPEAAIAFLGGFPLGVQRLYDTLWPLLPWVIIAMGLLGAILFILYLLVGIQAKTEAGKL